MIEKTWLRAYRSATALLLAGWLYSLTRLSSFERYAHARIVQSYFPAPMTWVWLAAVAWLVPAVLGLVVLVAPRPRILRAHATATALGSLVLVCHLRTFSFQVFPASLWASLWLVWVAWRVPQSRRDPSAEMRTGCFLAQLLVSLVYLGAVAGKWTGGWWSGETTYHLFFLQQSTPLFDWLRQSHPLVELRAWSVWYGRLAIAAEATIAASFLFPRRAALITCVLCMLGQWAVTTPYVIEALLPLFGLLTAGFVLDRHVRGELIPSHDHAAG